MNRSNDNREVSNKSVLWIPYGIGIGAILGPVFHEVSFGISMGMLFGATVTLAIEHRKKKAKAILPLLSAAAFIFILVLRLTKHG